MTLQLRDGALYFIERLPEWVDDRTRNLVAIAFASGAYASAKVAEHAGQAVALKQAVELCSECEAGLEEHKH